jgi:hypothetical protein
VNKRSEMEKKEEKRKLQKQSDKVTVDATRTVPPEGGNNNLIRDYSLGTCLFTLGATCVAGCIMIR